MQINTSFKSFHQSQLKKNRGKQPSSSQISCQSVQRPPVEKKILAERSFNERNILSYRNSFENISMHKPKRDHVEQIPEKHRDNPKQNTHRDGGPQNDPQNCLPVRGQCSMHSNATITHRNSIAPNTAIPHKRMFSNLQGQQRKKTAVELEKMNRNLFKEKYVIGRGGFGRVWRVEAKRTGKPYAMKQMSKALIISKKSVPSVMNEKQLLSKLTHPFIVNMVCSFQDRETLFLIMDYLPGGDLRHQIAKKKRFSEEEAKFLVACILLGLKYVHEQEIIHRDIKPENIVLDSQGYARLTDFGVARILRPENANDTSGTPGYMAPEVLCRQNHSYAVDYFALGVICYELMLRRRPYEGRNRKEIRDDVMARQVYVKKNEIPEEWSLESADFINRLIQRKASQRLGSKSIDQVMGHPWLRNFPFAKLAQKNLSAPFKPILVRENASETSIQSDEHELKDLIMQNEVMLRSEQVQNLFNGYEWRNLP